MILLTLFSAYLQIVLRAVKEYEKASEDRDTLVWNACVYPGTNVSS